MALLKDYEIPGTGVIIENAYHVVSDIKVEKRLADIQVPPDTNHPTGLTNGGVHTGAEVYWKAGYTATIAVTIYKDRAARDNDARPIGFIGNSPSDNKYGASIGTAGMDHRCVFLIDQSSPLDHMAQAYQHLLTTDYYSGSQQI
jgi:hypothetical protein